MADIGPQVALSLCEVFAEFRPRKPHRAEVHRMADELLGWSLALGALRTTAPPVRQNA
ncbi:MULTISPECIES: hypothetical protein [unclassified Streptomyces]|uniref:hypothetical protein n=1 Tax=unclassified Streptomyces TaxID=2593676 RepID=UPI000AC438EA|nr:MULTISPECIES: hypothetical protein [unclassified Streptomyces]